MKKIKIIPEPQWIRFRRKQEFVIDKNCQIITDEKCNNIFAFAVKILSEKLEKILREKISIIRGGKSNGKKKIITFKMLDKNNMKLLSDEKEIDIDRLLEEGYFLDVTAKEINIKAVSLKGIFYGIQTLIQLINKKTIPCVEVIDYPALEIRGIFIHCVPDLRWYPGSQTPKLEYLKGLIKQLSQYKINTLIIEYGDKFSYEKHPALNHKAAFTKDEIRELVDFADKYYIEIIPLLQSLGHLDYLLQHKEYAHLKEGGKEGRQTCPLNPGSFKLFTELAEEIIELHPETKHFHIGADETRELGDCPKCKEEVKRVGKDGLYVNHVNKICHWVKERGKIPIIWDDILCRYPETVDILDKDAIIMYWDYCAISKRNPLLIPRAADRGLVYDKRWKTKWRKELSNLDRDILEKCAQPIDLEKDLGDKYLSVFRKYLGKEFPKYITPFPYINFYKDKGFKVIGAPYLCGEEGLAKWYIYPHFQSALPHISTYCQRLSDKNSLGIVSTWWTAEAIPFETSWYSIIGTAEYSWHPRRFLRKDYDLRFSFQFFGIDNTEIAKAIRSLRGEIPYAQIYAQRLSLDEQIKRFEKSKEVRKELKKIKGIKRKAVIALDILNRYKGKINKNELSMKYLILSAKTIGHKANQLLIFHKVELRLKPRNSGIKTREIIKELEDLKKELLNLKRETEEVFSMSMKSSEVEEEISMRYGKEEEKMDKYLSELKSKED